MKKYTIDVYFTEEEEEKFEMLLNECNSLPYFKWDKQTALNFIYPKRSNEFLELFEFLIESTKKNFIGRK